MGHDGAAAKPRKVLLLTGATGRLGTALCDALRPEYDIVAVYHRRRITVASDRQSFVDPLHPDRVLEDNANPVYEIEADLAKPDDVTRIVELTMARFGRVDVVINAAGVSGQGLLLAGGLARAERVMRINAFAPIELVGRISDASWRFDDLGNRAANRCVVNVSSAVTVDVRPQTRTALFAASKAALNLLTSHLAAELEPYKVRVNAVAPVDFPDEISVDRVVSAIRDLVEGSDTGRMLLLWSDEEELV